MNNISEKINKKINFLISILKSIDREKYIINIEYLLLRHLYEIVIHENIKKNQTQINFLLQKIIKYINFIQVKLENKNNKYPFPPLNILSNLSDDELNIPSKKRKKNLNNSKLNLRRKIVFNNNIYPPLSKLSNVTANESNFSKKNNKP